MIFPEFSTSFVSKSHYVVSITPLTNVHSPTVAETLTCTWFLEKLIELRYMRVPGRLLPEA